jgi:hypothetical protein
VAASDFAKLLTTVESYNTGSFYPHHYPRCATGPSGNALDSVDGIASTTFVEQARWWPRGARRAEARMSELEWIV